MFNLIAYLDNTLLTHISPKMGILYFELNFCSAIINACHICCHILLLLMLSEVLTSLSLVRVVRIVFILQRCTFQPLSLYWHFPRGSFLLFVLCVPASLVCDVLWYVWKCTLTVVSYCRCWVWAYWESVCFVLLLLMWSLKSYYPQ
jgi:hypothetical protein